MYGLECGKGAMRNREVRWEGGNHRAGKPIRQECAMHGTGRHGNDFGVIFKVFFFKKKIWGSFGGEKLNSEEKIVRSGLVYF